MGEPAGPGQSKNLSQQFCFYTLWNSTSKLMFESLPRRFGGPPPNCRSEFYFGIFYFWYFGRLDCWQNFGRYFASGFSGNPQAKYRAQVSRFSHLCFRFVFDFRAGGGLSTKGPSGGKLQPSALRDSCLARCENGSKTSPKTREKAFKTIFISMNLIWTFRVHLPSQCH